MPTAEEVSTVFESLLQGVEGEITREEYDESGDLLLLDIRTEADENGEYSEYSYDRKGRPKEGETSPIMIYVAYYDRDGMPYGGDTLGEYIDGGWKFAK